MQGVLAGAGKACPGKGEADQACGVGEKATLPVITTGSPLHDLLKQTP
jgi:hypothetical protein